MFDWALPRLTTLDDLTKAIDVKFLWKAPDLDLTEVDAGELGSRAFYNWQ